MNNIFDMLIEYTKKGKIVDRTFIEFAINTLKQERNLEEYVKEIEFKDYCSENKDIVMRYSDSDNCIEVMQGCINDFIKMVQNFSKPSPYEKLLIINSYILKVIIHELYHAEQNKLSKGYGTDFESLYFQFQDAVQIEFENALHNGYVTSGELDSCCRKKLLIRKLDKTYGKANLSERLADNRAYTEMIDLICGLDGNLYATVNYYANSITNCFLAGYNHQDKISSPTMRYLSECASENFTLYNEVKAKAEELSEAPFDVRLTYGLHLTTEEYNQVKDFSYIKKRFPVRYQ